MSPAGCCCGSWGIQSRWKAWSTLTTGESSSATTPRRWTSCSSCGSPPPAPSESPRRRGVSTSPCRTILANSCAYSADHLVPAVRAAVRAGQPPAHRPLQPVRSRRVHERGRSCRGQEQPLAYLVPRGHAVQEREAAPIQEGIRARRAADEAAHRTDGGDRHAPGMEEQQREGPAGAAHREDPAAGKHRRLGGGGDQRVRGDGAVAVHRQPTRLAEATRRRGRQEE